MLFAQLSLRKLLCLIAVPSLALFLSACGGGNSSLNPVFQPQVANATDTFQFQSTGVTNVSEILSYNWDNSGVQANINQACAITSGTATLTIRDSSGAMVYSQNLVQNGTFHSIVGPSGGWVIQINLQGVNGTLNFRVQKTP